MSARKRPPGRPRKPTKWQRMTISIDPELQARLQRIAATTDRSASAVVRLAVTSFLEAEK